MTDQNFPVSQVHLYLAQIYILLLKKNELTLQDV